MRSYPFFPRFFLFLMVRESTPGVTLAGMPSLNALKPVFFSSVSLLF